MRVHSIPAPQVLHPHDNLLDDLVSYLEPLDKSRFEQTLNGAVAVIPFEEAVQRILLPLQRRVGELWHEGRLNVAIEHYVTKIVQQKLFSVMNQLATNEFGPRVLIACPEGEFHEIGAQAVAYIAAARGCHVYYLGPNLPTSDLRLFCERVNPDLALLSLKEITSDEAARQLLKELEPLSKHWTVAFGGQGARSIEHLLRNSRIELLDDLTALYSRLVVLLSQKMLARPQPQPQPQPQVQPRPQPQVQPAQAPAPAPTSQPGVLIRGNGVGPALRERPDVNGNGRGPGRGPAAPGALSRAT